MNKNTPISTRISAFSLTELAIVISIIAILIAVISGAKSLQNNALIRATISEVQFYRNAVNNFYLIYNYYPGDFPYAFNQWGSRNGCTNAAVNSSSTGCNGDGDGTIGTTVFSTGEPFLAWLHLTNAGMITGNFSGTFQNPSTSVNGAAISVNVPGSSYQGNCYLIQTCAPGNGNICSNFINGNVISLGGPVALGQCYNGTIKLIDAYNIDLKIDDGMPNSGNINAINFVGSSTISNINCASGSLTSSTYNFSTTLQNGCALELLL